jgi:uncharacterized protein (DUF2384 family)
MAERYEVEIRTDSNGRSLVIVIDMDSGRRLTGSTGSGAAQMVGVLIEDHRERREADLPDHLLEEAKQRRREAITQAALSAFARADEARAWLTSPNDHLRGRRPLAVAGGSDDGLAAAKKLLSAAEQVRVAQEQPALKM